MSGDLPVLPVDDTINMPDCEILEVLWVSLEDVFHQFQGLVFLLLAHQDERVEG